MPTITIRLFARLADVAGTRSADLEIGEGLSAADAYRALAAAHPALAPLQPTVLYAVNQEYVTADHPLRPGDELALIPPVSGGAQCTLR